jgi:DNA-binding CsgD family transcriptional regulator
MVVFLYLEESHVDGAGPMRTNQLRLRDISSVFQLVAECRELWADADAWQTHLLKNACRLTGASVGIFTEQRLSSDRKSTEILDETEHGWRDQAAGSLRARMLAEHPDRVAFLPRCYRLAGRALDGAGVATALRPEMRSDAQWYRSGLFNEYHRPAGIDGVIMSFAVIPHNGNLITLTVHQGMTDREPTSRAKSIISLLNSQIAPLVGVSLTSNGQCGLRGLSPRLRQTLDAMLAGDAEKQVAARLGVSVPTAHQYVGSIYHHFGVTSRPELMAYFVRRRPQHSPLTPPHA